ncbi:MAG: sigma-54-dependent transcriptional regulator, partial [Candidatus Binatia bacterium]
VHELGSSFTVRTSQAPMLHAFILDDDPTARSALAELVETEGFAVTVAGSIAEARERLTQNVPDVALVDQFLPDGNGLDIIEELENLGVTDTVLITGNANVESAIGALRLRVRDYLIKPIDVLRLKVILANILRTRELKREIGALRGALLELGRFGPLIGASAAMQRVYDMIEKVAGSEITVLITGESGTGKEVVANALHGLSRRRNGPFRAVNCGAISPTLIESELFGHERGSFTGAARLHRGYFEQAGLGTLLLDEITEMPKELQVKLLRALETRTITRIGGEQPLPIDVRVIAASNQDPDEAVSRGDLRQDLLYRLSGFRLNLPPLREREDDVQLLAEHFLGQMNRTEGSMKRFGAGVAEKLHGYSWPGNVRELKNVVQQAFIMAEEEIGPELVPSPNGTRNGDADCSLPVGTSLAEADRQLILATLEKYGGNKRKTAEVLGISLKTLYNRLRAYDSPSS